jgi:hypothetical protein
MASLDRGPERGERQAENKNGRRGCAGRLCLYILSPCPALRLCVHETAPPVGDGASGSGCRHPNRTFRSAADRAVIGPAGMDPARAATPGCLCLPGARSGRVRCEVDRASLIREHDPAMFFVSPAQPTRRAGYYSSVRAGAFVCFFLPFGSWNFPCDSLALCVRPW